MKLHRITLENYRVHKSLSVSFDQYRNLIGGNNETGKSTLVEAAHRVLFMRYKTGGELQKEMVSSIHAGHPKVTLEFFIGKEKYTIEKEFRGQNGSALLSSESGETWLNDEAENKLRALLQVNEYGMGNAFKSQWSHLWITQGSSGENPSEEASNYANELIQRLETEGAGALQQSPRDQAAADHFAEQYAVHFTATGKPRANSPALQAEALVEQASEVLSDAEAALQSLEGSRKIYLDADAACKELGPKLIQYREQRTGLEKDLNQAKSYRDQLDRKTDKLAVLEKGYADLVKKDEEMAKLGEELKLRKAELDALGTTKENLLARYDSAKKHLESLDANALRSSLAKSRILVDYWKQQVGLLEETGEANRLATRKAKLLPILKEIEKLKAAIQQLPPISESTAREFFQLETQIKTTRDQLESISTRIEIESPHPVFQGNDELSREPFSISEPVELRVGDPESPTCIRITPGGGVGLRDTEAKIQRLEDELAEKLAKCGFDSTRQARDARAKRETLENELKELEHDALELGGKDLLERHAQIEKKIADQRQALADLISRFETPPQLTEDLEEAKKQFVSAREALESLAKQEEETHEQYKIAKEASQLAERELKDHQIKTDQLARERLARQSKAETLAEEHGDQTNRELRLKQFQKDIREVKSEIETLQNQLDRINPKELEREYSRLAGIIESSEKTIAEAETQMAVARDRLSQMSDSDPAELLAEARAAFSRSESEHRRISNQAKAHHLLHSLFQEEKKELANQLTAPLCERVENYLEPIFGGQVSVSLDCGEDHTFQSLALARGGHRFDFSSLSGGTKEQLAAAFRLALAEILAEDHDGCLPLVFDDAFTHSDPERVKQLQSMLDTAAERGLQLILLSCSPSQYAELDAKETFLDCA